MGCSICTKVVTLKTADMIYQKDSAPSSKRSSVFNDRVPSKCIKIYVQPSLHPLSLRNFFDKSTSVTLFCKPYQKYFLYLKSQYLQFTSLFNHFSQLTHSVCLPQKLKHSLKVMVVSMISSLDGIFNPKFVENLHVFPIKESQLKIDTFNMYNTWGSLMKTVQQILDKDNQTESLEETEKQLKHLAKEMEKNQRKFVVTEYKKKFASVSSMVEMAKDLKGKAQRIIFEAGKFFIRLAIDDEDVQKIGKSAVKLKAYSGKDIVHNLMHY